MRSAKEDEMISASVSRFLTSKGFVRSTSSRSMIRGCPHRSRGFRVTQSVGDSCEVFQEMGSYCLNQEDAKNRQAMLARYAEVLSEAYTVRAEGFYLIVSKKEE